MYITFTTSKVTARYKYIYTLSYLEIQLIRFICSYCIFIYKKYVILLCLIINHHKTIIISQISNQWLCYIL